MRGFRETIARSSKADTYNTSTATETRPAKIRDMELRLRKIEIVEGSVQEGSKWLPGIDPLALTEIGHLQLTSSAEFTRTVRKWAHSYSTFSSPAKPEFQWTADIYSKFLPQQAEPPGVAGDTLRLHRELQPWVSLKLGDYVLLPPKDVTMEGPGGRRKKKRVSELPAELGSVTAPPSLQTMQAQQQRMCPDIMYASSLSALESHANYIKYPAIRTFASIRLLPPYLIGEFKNTEAQETEAHKSLAMLGAMLLLERVKLRRQSLKPTLADLKLFALTCCGPLVTLYCMTIPTTGEKVRIGDLLSYHMIRCSAYDLSDESSIADLARTMNRIHTYGRTRHLAGIKNDLDAVTAVSFADVDKYSYQHKNGDQFDHGDELMLSARDIAPSNSGGPSISD